MGGVRRLEKRMNEDEKKIMHRVVSKLRKILFVVLVEAAKVIHCNNVKTLISTKRNIPPTPPINVQLLAI